GHRQRVSLVRLEAGHTLGDVHRRALVRPQSDLYGRGRHLARLPGLAQLADPPLVEVPVLALARLRGERLGLEDLPRDGVAHAGLDALPRGAGDAEVEDLPLDGERHWS